MRRASGAGEIWPKTLRFGVLGPISLRFVRFGVLGGPGRCAFWRFGVLRKTTQNARYELSVQDVTTEAIFFMKIGFVGRLR